MYGKIFEQMYDGSLHGQWQAIVTFQQMIVLAGDDGVVDLTPSALSARTSIPLDIIVAGIEQLEAPDPKSRTPDEDGRRITRLDNARDWGWHITNHDKYRRIRSAEERRAYMREYQRNRRKQSRKQPSTLSTESKPRQPMQYAVSSIQDTETETTKEKSATHGEVDLSAVDGMTALAERLPLNAVDALGGLVRASRNPPSFVAEIAGMLDGMAPPAVDPPTLGRALRDMVANGDPPRMALLRAYVKRQRREDNGDGEGLSESEKFMRMTTPAAS